MALRDPVSGIEGSSARPFIDATARVDIVARIFDRDNDRGRSLEELVDDRIRELSADLHSGSGG